MMSVIMMNVIMQCHCTEWRQAKCHGALKSFIASISGTSTNAAMPKSIKALRK